MGKNLIAAPSQDILTKMASFLKNSVASAGLVIRPEKIQHSEHWKYLGYILLIGQSGLKSSKLIHPRI